MYHIICVASGALFFSRSLSLSPACLLARSLQINRGAKKKRSSQNAVNHNMRARTMSLRFDSVGVCVCVFARRDLVVGSRIVVIVFRCHHHHGCRRKRAIVALLMSAHILCDFIECLLLLHVFYVCVLLLLLVLFFLLNTSFAKVESSLYGFFFVRKPKIDGMRSRKRLNKPETVGD